MTVRMVTSFGTGQSTTSKDLIRLRYTLALSFHSKTRRATIPAAVLGWVSGA